MIFISCCSNILKHIYITLCGRSRYVHHFEQPHSARSTSDATQPDKFLQNLSLHLSWWPAAKLIHQCSPFEWKLSIIAYDQSHVPDRHMTKLACDYSLLEIDKIGRAHLQGGDQCSQQHNKASRVNNCLNTGGFSQRFGLPVSLFAGRLIAKSSLPLDNKNTWASRLPR